METDHGQKPNHPAWLWLASLAGRRKITGMAADDGRVAKARHRRGEQNSDETRARPPTIRTTSGTEHDGFKHHRVILLQLS
jgi:hypothetical protein